MIVGIWKCDGTEDISVHSLSSTSWIDFILLKPLTSCCALLSNHLREKRQLYWRSFLVKSQYHPPSPSGHILGRKVVLRVWVRSTSFFFPSLFLAPLPPSPYLLPWGDSGCHIKWLFSGSEPGTTAKDFKWALNLFGPVMDTVLDKVLG